jgi:hypothetical protein
MWYIKVYLFKSVELWSNETIILTRSDYCKTLQMFQVVCLKYFTFNKHVYLLPEDTPNKMDLYLKINILKINWYFQTDLNSNFIRRVFFMLENNLFCSNNLDGILMLIFDKKIKIGFSTDYKSYKWQNHTFTQ